MTTAFGIDLSGYSAGKSVLAKAHRVPHQIIVTIYENTPLATKLTGDQLLAESVQAERDLVRRCCQEGYVMVDIPLDLQGLPLAEPIDYTWQLTRRPVDYALRGMPPLADRIGAAVARFQYILSGLPDVIIGKHIFETYPALMLDLMGLPLSRYKGQPIIFSEGKWQGGLLAELATQLNFVAEDNTQLNDDEFDAILCALAGVADPEDRLEGDVLRETINRKLREKLPDCQHEYDPPAGYSVMRKRPSEKTVICKTNDLYQIDH